MKSSVRLLLGAFLALSALCSAGVAAPFTSAPGPIIDTPFNFLSRTTHGPIVGHDSHVVIEGINWVHHIDIDAIAGIGEESMTVFGDLTHNIAPHGEPIGISMPYSFAFSTMFLAGGVYNSPVTTVVVPHVNHTNTMLARLSVTFARGAGGGATISNYAINVAAFHTPGYEGPFVIPEPTTAWFACLGSVVLIAQRKRGHCSAAA